MLYIMHITLFLIHILSITKISFILIKLISLLLIIVLKHLKINIYIYKSIIKLLKVFKKYLFILSIVCIFCYKKNLTWYFKHCLVLKIFIIIFLLTLLIITLIFELVIVFKFLKTTLFFNNLPDAPFTLTSSICINTSNCHFHLKFIEIFIFSGRIFFNNFFRRPLSPSPLQPEALFEHKPRIFPRKREKLAD